MNKESNGESLRRKEVEYEFTNKPGETPSKCFQAKIEYSEREMLVSIMTPWIEWKKQFARIKKNQENEWM